MCALSVFISTGLTYLFRYIWPSANYGHQYGGPYAWSKSSTPKAEAKKDKKKDKKGKKKSSSEYKHNHLVKQV